MPVPYMRGLPVPGSSPALGSRWRYSATLATAESGGMEKIRRNLVFKEVNSITSGKECRSHHVEASVEGIGSGMDKWKGCCDRECRTSGGWRRLDPRILLPHRRGRENGKPEKQNNNETSPN